MNLLDKLGLDKLGLDKLDKKKIIVIILLSLSLLYVDFTFIVKAQLKSIGRITPKIIKLKKDISSLNKDLITMQKMQSGLQQNKQSLASTTKRFISEEELTALLQDISNVADKYQVKIMQIKPSKDIKAQEETIAERKFLPLKVNLDLSCGYHALGSFINELENASQFMEAQEIRITRDPADYFKRNVNLILKVYVKK